jgi:hypothetical protein
MNQVEFCYWQKQFVQLLRLLGPASIASTPRLMAKRRRSWAPMRNAGLDAGARFSPPVVVLGGDAGGRGSHQRKKVLTSLCQRVYQCFAFEKISLWKK